MVRDQISLEKWLKGIEKMSKYHALRQERDKLAKQLGLTRAEYLEKLRQEAQRSKH